MSSSESTKQQVTLTNCDIEPIHIPGSIQPHGVLIALQEPELTIMQVSENTQSIVGLVPQDLLQHPLDILIEASQLATIRQLLSATDLRFVKSSQS